MKEIDPFEMKEKLTSLLEGLECDPEFWIELSANQLRYLGALITMQAKRSPGMFDKLEIAKAIAGVE
jgi:hypothetical protein